MNIAPLRQQAVELFTSVRHGWPFWLLEQEPELPSYTERLFTLAYIAVGDADSAAIQVADVIALQPVDEGAAMRLLVERLPQGWLSWPGAAGPAEWLRLGLRREQADRLLSVLGEWDAVARIGLALWLLYDVRRDDLDGWLGTQNMADRIAEFVGYVGEGLDIVDPSGERPECANVAADLIDANQPQVGRLVRLHIIGCDVCRQRVNGLQQTSKLLKLALNVFFRASVPHDLARLVVIRRRQMRQPPVHLWKPLLVSVVLLLLYVGVVRKPAANAASTPPLQNATEILDLAINRFSAPPLRSGVLHERVRFGTGDDVVTLERWFDYSGFNRYRLTVRRGDAPPLLDFGTDGSSYFTAEMQHDGGEKQSLVMRGQQTVQVMPLIRQLPMMSSFAGPIVPQEYLDTHLLGVAKRGNASLLGVNSWQGRPAYMLMSTTANRERMILTIDQETLGLLEARIAPLVGTGSQPRRVWTVESIEVVPRAQVAARTFELPARESAVAIANPRQLTRRPSTPVGLEEVVSTTPLAIPDTLPEPSILAYIRDRTRTRTSILQFYEGQWSTLMVESPRIIERSLPRRLNQEFAHGRYSELRHSLPQTTIIEFVMDDRQDRRMRLYLWHALASDEERAQLALNTLNSMTLVDGTNAELFKERFITLPANLSVQRVSDLPQIRFVSADPRRRFTRFKFEQALARLENDSDPDDTLIP